MRTALKLGVWIGFLLQQTDGQDGAGEAVPGRRSRQPGQRGRDERERRANAKVLTIAVPSTRSREADSTRPPCASSAARPGDRNQPGKILALVILPPDVQRPDADADAPPREPPGRLRLHRRRPRPPAGPPCRPVHDRPGDSPASSVVTPAPGNLLPLWAARGLPDEAARATDSPTSSTHHRVERRDRMRILASNDITGAVDNVVLPSGKNPIRIGSHPRMDVRL